jgi:hypothetical protein
MEIQQVVARFRSLGFQMLHETRKVSAYCAPGSGLVVYLRKDSGLPGRARVVLNPTFDAERVFELDGVGRPRITRQHGANMRLFPKRRNKGDGDIHYGTPVDLLTLDGLDRALSAYDR